MTSAIVAIVITTVIPMLVVIMLVSWVEGGSRAYLGILLPVSRLMTS